MKKSIIGLLGAAAVAAIVLFACCPCRKSNSVAIEIPVGSAWQALQVESKTVTTEEDNFVIIFGPEGQLSGIGSCNRIMGKYETAENKKVSIQGMGSTRAMCPNQQMEDRFFAALQSSDSYTIEGEKLMLLKDGNVIMILESFELPK